MISQYWTNQIPGRPLSILIKDEAGTDLDLSSYTTITAKMLGSRNEEISLEGSTLNTASKSLGKIIFFWPTERSLFNYPGDYVFQLELTGTGKKDFTSTHTIRVREFGKGNKK